MLDIFQGGVSEFARQNLRPTIVPVNASADPGKTAMTIARGLPTVVPAIAPIIGRNAEKTQNTIGEKHGRKD